MDTNNYNKIIEESIAEYIQNKENLNENEENELFRDNWAGLKGMVKNWGNTSRNGGSHLNDFNQARLNYYARKAGYPQANSPYAIPSLEDDRWSRGGNGAVASPIQPHKTQRKRRKRNTSRATSTPTVTPIPQPQAQSGETQPTVAPTPQTQRRSAEQNRQHRWTQLQQQQNYIKFYGNDEVIYQLIQKNPKKFNDFLKLLGDIRIKIDFYSHTKEQQIVQEENSVEDINTRKTSYKQSYFGNQVVKGADGNEYEMSQILESYKNVIRNLHRISKNRQTHVAQNLNEDSMIYNKTNKYGVHQDTRNKVSDDYVDSHADSFQKMNINPNVSNERGEWMYDLRKLLQELVKKYHQFFGEGLIEIFNWLILILRRDTRLKSLILPLLVIVGLGLTTCGTATTQGQPVQDNQPSDNQTQIDIDFQYGQADALDMNELSQIQQVAQQMKGQTITFHINGANNKYGGKINPQLFQQRANLIQQAFAQHGVNAHWDGDYSQNTNGETASVTFQKPSSNNQMMESIIQEELNKYLKNMLC